MDEMHTNIGTFLKLNPNNSGKNAPLTLLTEFSNITKTKRISNVFSKNIAVEPVRNKKTEKKQKLAAAAASLLPDYIAEGELTAIP
ncbi:MAG TPA: hypothetical protein VJ440_13715 [Candidatus Brocadiaceae bacterium]|nr:hypothetical protein [Candidatus Brocadiaceae bacterium]